MALFGHQPCVVATLAISCGSVTTVVTPRGTTAAQFAAAVVPRGVTTVVTDPHEIANVAGADGVRFMAESANGLPVNLVLMAPSCVPATPMASGGGAIDVDDLHTLREQGIARGLAEVMNYRAVTGGEAAMLAKIATMKGRPVDGHCPAVTGRSLNAYVAVGTHYRRAS